MDDLMIHFNGPETEENWKIRQELLPQLNGDLKQSIDAILTCVCLPFLIAVSEP
jgi:hypothetical protein